MLAFLFCLIVLFRGADVCQCVCSKTFMTDSFPEVKHVVMDEVQNFRAEDGKWLRKARRLVRAGGREKDPGYLWLFIDNSQLIHSFEKGIPSEIEQVYKVECEKYQGGESQLICLTRVLTNLFSEGFREGDISVLYGKGDCIPGDLSTTLGLRIVTAEENASNNLVVSTLRMYCGLERPVIVIVDLMQSLPYGSHLCSSMYCAVTRAMVKLVVIEQK